MRAKQAPVVCGRRPNKCKWLHVHAGGVFLVRGTALRSVGTESECPCQRAWPFPSTASYGRFVIYARRDEGGQFPTHSAAFGDIPEVPEGSFDQCSALARSTHAGICAAK